MRSFRFRVSGAMRFSRLFAQTRPVSRWPHTLDHNGLQSVLQNSYVEGSEQ